jgi:hypothetical protein
MSVECEIVLNISKCNGYTTGIKIMIVHFMKNNEIVFLCHTSYFFLNVKEL